MPHLILLLLSMTVSLASHASEPAHFVPRSLELHGKTYRYQVFVPDGWTAKREWPVVLFLHGSGERGSDNHSQLSQGLPPWLVQPGKDFPAVVVFRRRRQTAPGAARSSRWPCRHWMTAS